MIPENKLTGAERGVLATFRAGAPAVDIARAAIRGDFLRGLFLGEYDERADYRGTRIIGAVIPDALDMEFCETKFPVRLHESFFAQKIKLQHLACSELDLSGSTFEGGIDALGAKLTGGMRLINVDATAEVSLFGANIGGQLICTKGNFQNGDGYALIAQSIKVAGEVFLDQGFNALGEVSFLGADINGQLNCMGGRFQNRKGNALNAQNVKVATDVVLRNGFNAEGAVWLVGADIKGQLDCSGGSFQNKEGYALNAECIKVAANVFLDDGFNAEGKVNLFGAEVGGQLDCAGGLFQNRESVALIAQNIKVGADVVLRGFKAKGEVWLVGADIKGQLDCSGGSFQSKGRVVALNAQSIKVASHVFLRNGFNAVGAVWLADADIGGELDCAGGSFQNKEGAVINARGVNVNSNVFLTPYATNFSANGQLYFANATVGGNFVLDNCELTHLSLTGANVLGEFQDDAGVYKNDQGDNIDLDIDGFCYRRLDAAKERVKDRLAWVGLMSKGDEFRPQPYEQLMKVYRDMGHMNWARDVGFALEEKRHGVINSWMWKVWYRVLRHTIGYGYKPFRALTHWFAPLIVAGLVLFGGSSFFPDSCRAGNEAFYCMAPSDAGVLLSDDWKIHGKLPKDYPDFSPVYYAVETALPVLPLGQTENWHPKTWWVRRAQAAITIIGALVLTVLAYYGVGVLGPRWKNE